MNAVSSDVDGEREDVQRKAKEDEDEEVKSFSPLQHRWPFE